MDLAETIATIIEKGEIAYARTRTDRWLSAPADCTEKDILDCYSLLYDALSEFKGRVGRYENVKEGVSLAEELAGRFEGVEGSGALGKRVDGLERECDDELRLMAGKYQALRKAYDIAEFQAAYLVFSNHPELGDFSRLDPGKRAEIFEGYMMKSTGYSFRNVRFNAKALLENNVFDALKT